MSGYCFSKSLTTHVPVAKVQAELLGRGGLSQVGQTLLYAQPGGYSQLLHFQAAPETPERSGKGLWSLGVTPQDARTKGSF